MFKIPYFLQPFHAREKRYIAEIREHHEEDRNQWSVSTLGNTLGHEYILTDKTMQ